MLNALILFINTKKANKNIFHVYALMIVWGVTSQVCVWIWDIREISVLCLFLDVSCTCIHMTAPTLLDFADYLYNKQELYHNIMKKLSDSITICII